MNRCYNRKLKIVNKRRFISFLFILSFICVAIITLFVNVNCKTVPVNVELVDTKSNEQNINTDIEEKIEEANIPEPEPKETNNLILKPELLKEEHFNIMVELSKVENVPLNVMLAILTVENQTYDETITYTNTNGTIDIGICQINSAYIDYFGRTYNIQNFNPYDVSHSLLFLARHLKYLSNYAITEYNMNEYDSYIFAAGAYNRGLSNEIKYGNMYSYKEKFITNLVKFGG